MSVLVQVERLQEVIQAAIAHDRPQILPPMRNGLREELQKFPHWVVWEAVWEDDSGSSYGGKWLKIPYNPVYGTHASAGVPGSWGDFEAAWKAYTQSNGRYGGVGFMLTEEDPFTVLVVDGAVTDDETLLPEALSIVRTLKTYTELTSDGRGVQMITLANLPPGGRRRGPVELHESDGFFAVTGRHFEGTPEKVQSRQPEIEALHADLFPPPSHGEREKEPRISPFANSPAAGSDRDLLALAFHTANGPRIEALYTGRTSSINGDRNAADLALCSMLGFYTGNDPVRLDRLFRASSLFREKWDTPHYSDGRTYGQATVAKALDGCIAFYAPVTAKSSDASVLPPKTGINDSGARHNFAVARQAGQLSAPFPVAQGSALHECVFTPQEAAKFLKISVRLLRDTVKPWKRFGVSPAGDRWLLSHLLERDLDDGV